MAGDGVWLDDRVDVMAQTAAPRRIEEPFPATEADLAGPWLPNVLGMPNADQHQVSVRRIGQERGHMGSAYRLAFVCSHSDHPVESVVVKLPATGEEARATAHRGGLYAREFRFFDELAYRSPVSAPACFAGGYAENGLFALVLEDLGGAREIDQVAGCDLQHARIVLAELASFHASWWEAPALNAMPWATRHTDPHRVDNLTELMRKGWPRLCAALGDLLGADALATGQSITASLGEAFEALRQQPQTLLHGDVRLDNLLFRDEAEACSVVLLDWQSLSRGAGAIDVSYFLAQNITPAGLRADGETLLLHYQQCLSAAGVEYPLAELRRAVSLALPLTFAVASSLYVLADAEEERTRELALAMAARSIAAVQLFGQPADSLS